MLGKTGRHMSSQRQEQVFQVCTLSTLYPIQTGLGMLGQGDGEQGGVVVQGSLCQAEHKAALKRDGEGDF